MAQHLTICPTCGFCDFCARRERMAEAEMKMKEIRKVAEEMTESVLSEEEKRKADDDREMKKDVEIPKVETVEKTKGPMQFILFKNPHSCEASDTEDDKAEDDIPIETLKQYSLECLAKGSKRLEELIMEKHAMEKDQEKLAQQMRLLGKRNEEYTEKFKVFKKEIAKYERVNALQLRLIKANTRQQYFAIQFGMPYKKYAADGYECGCLPNTNCECL